MPPYGGEGDKLKWVCRKIGKYCIDNIYPPMAFRPGKNNKNILSLTGRKSEGVMGVSGGVWECGKPERFSIISMPQSEGEKGEVTFSLRPRRGRSLAPPFPPMGLQNVRKEV